MISDFRLMVEYEGIETRLLEDYTVLTSASRSRTKMLMYNAESSYLLLENSMPYRSEI